MTLDTAKECIDWIFTHIPEYATGGVEVGFIGGEPLLEFDLLTQVYDYTAYKYSDIKHIFYATTNGTVIDERMKEWFSTHNKDFVLGLSLDGTKETHNNNRCGSFDSIDFDFFLSNWPKQGVKMTLSEYSIPKLAENIKFIYSLGFNRISGVNLCEGDFDWNKDEYISILIPQLKELVDFYVENNTLPLNQMFDKRLAACEWKDEKPHKWCGIGTGCIFFDTDGKRYPCSFITPMTFEAEDLNTIMKTDFDNKSNFVDDECSKNCYIYPLCPICYGANYLNRKTFKVRDKSKCRLQKLIIVFAADLHAKRILKDKSQYDEKTLYDTIEAIKKIRYLYLPEFESFGLSDK